MTAVHKNFLPNEEQLKINAQGYCPMGYSILGCPHPFGHIALMGGLFNVFWKLIETVCPNPFSVTAANMRAAK